MLDAIARFFSARIDPGTAGPDDAERRLQVATCALLLEAAHADDDFGPEERLTVGLLVQERFGLSRPEAGELIALAEEERERSTDLYQFTRLIDRHFDRPRKLAVLEQLWRVVYSDGRLDAHEDALLHKLCNLLGLKHNELIALKLRVKSQEEPKDR